MSNLIELGRKNKKIALNRQAEALRSSKAPSAAAFLELACAWLLAGEPQAADLAFVEADLLDPSLALVPDRWGLWPAPPPAADAHTDRIDALAWADCFRAWRHPDPQALWQELLPKIQTDWRSVLEPETGDRLLILGRISQPPQGLSLDPPLEAFLAPLVDDAQIQAEPAASHRFWQLVATIRPGWDLARIRAADLALARGEHEGAARWLADPPAEALINPWFHDVAARQALQRGAVQEAMQSWGEAIRMAQAQPSLVNLADLFERRRREARRGPGVLQVRSLFKQGDANAALTLLDALLDEDPQWQPFHSLREQLGVARDNQPRHEEILQAAEPTETKPEAGAITALLDRCAARLEALGLPLAPPTEAIALLLQPPSDAAAAETQLMALSQRFSSYEARFAMA